MNRAVAGSLGKRAFTVIELMVAVAIVATTTAMACLCLGGVVRAWRRGAALTEDLHHGDYLMEQLVLGLRSAYFPDVREGVIGYGFLLENDGSGEGATDSISWVKQGDALTETNSPTISNPHRVQVLFEKDKDGELGPCVRVWRPYSQPEDFSPDDIEPVRISRRIKGLDCRVASNVVDGAWNWQEEWEDDCTNRLPLAVELSLYLEPIEEGQPMIEIKRYVEIPAARLSWP